jgi:site-specific recombinase XerD
MSYRLFLFLARRCTLNAITVLQSTEIQPGADILALSEKWLAQLELRVASGEMAASTRQTYARGWGKFVAWLLARQIVQLTGDDIQTWLGELKKANSAAAVNVWFAGVKSFFAWAMRSRLLLFNPTSGIQGARRSGASRRHKRDVLTYEEVRRVLAIPDRTTPAGARNYAILCLMAYTGARTIEVHRADLADLRTEGGRLVLHVQGKGRLESDELIVVVNADLEDALHSWVATRRKKPGALFTSLSMRNKNGRLSARAIRRIVKNSYLAAGVVGDRKTTHSLRHTAITNAVKHGAPIQKVSHMARHTRLETTMIYYHEIDRLSDPAEGYIDYENQVR